MTKTKPVGLQDFKIEMVPIDQLKPYERNAKAHPEAQVEKIARSIKEYGIAKNIVINADNVIIAGHGSVLAYKKLGVGVVPCRRMTHLTPEQERGLSLMDNKSGESEWLPDMLSLEFEALADTDFDLTLTSFSPAELKEMSDLLADVTLKDVTTSTEKRNLGSKHHQVKPVLYVDQIDTFERALKATGEINRGAALLKICEAYLDTAG